MAAFNILEEKWLDVSLLDGSAASVSLRELLEQAGQIAALAEQSPLTECGLLRFLIALVSDGLRKRIETEEDWLPFLNACTTGFPVDLAQEILAPLKSQADVLATNHTAFFDGPAIQDIEGWDDPKSSQPATQTLPEIPTGTNIAHFMHASDDNSALCVACLIKSRAFESAFARGGLGPSLSRNLLASINGMEPRYVISRGSTLLETLLVNMQINDPSRPAWVQIYSQAGFPPGAIARLTWRPRLMMPLMQSQSDGPCVGCASTSRPCYSRVVIVDTYNRAEAPFGTKDDVKTWQSAETDPHILPSVKGLLNLGIRSEEWALRALSRLLAEGRVSAVDPAFSRLQLLQKPFALTVTASAGNQAKIDDAAISTLIVPGSVVCRARDEQAQMSEALLAIFDKLHSKARQSLIPGSVKDLVSELGTQKDPDEAVALWLQRAKGHQPPLTPPGPTDEQENLWESCRRTIRLLSALPKDQLAALRRPEERGSDPAWQAAFEKIWHRTNAGHKRHAYRQALAAVAAVFAEDPARNRIAHERGSVHKSIVSRLAQGRAGSGNFDSFRQLIARMTALSEIRSQLLSAFVRELCDTGAARRRIDYADLLYELSRWNEQEDATRVNWKTLL